MGLPVFIKMGLFMAAVFISNIVQALTGFAGVMLSIPPTILLYGPDMAKAVINVICWLVCVYLMVKNREYINKKELGRIILFMLIGMAAGIYLYNIVDARILVPVYGLLIVGVALKNLLLKPSGASLPVWVAIPVLLGAGIIHGMKTIVLQDKFGMIEPVHSISAGLDYPGVGPEHAHLHEISRAKYEAVTDDECITALKLLCRLEGIIPAIESAHALAYLEKLCPQLKGKKTIVVNVSGRGDKDMDTVMNYKKGTIYG